VSSAGKDTTPESSATTNNRLVYKQIAQGSAWAILMRWAIRGIGLVSVVILARLLTPEDFGIVAMASILIGLIREFSELGVTMHLIRQPTATREHCDTAWTMRLLQGVFVAIALVAFAAPASWYFREPRLVDVIHVLAASALIAGAENIGMVLVRKELNFALDFRFSVYRRLIAFFVTVTLAWWLRDYWALVWGQLASSMLEVALSYIMHPYRPRFSLSKAREYFRFALYIFPINIARYVRERFDVLVVGRIAPAPTVGLYNVSSELASLASQEILFPLGRALFPNYAKLAHDLPRLTEVFLGVVATVSMLAIPLALGMVLVAQDFVGLLLGDKWLGVVPLLKWLSVYGVASALGAIFSGNILLVTGHERLGALSMWINIVILFPLILIGATIWGVNGVVWMATTGAIISLPVTGYMLTRAVPVTLLELARAVWPSLAAGIVMIVLVRLMVSDSIQPSALRLAVTVLVGAIVYVGAIFFLWRLRGSPSGVERTVADFIVHRLPLPR
jgi:lipopolysaccharide exporter